MVKKILAESKSHRGKRSPIRDPSSFHSFLRLCNSISTTFTAMEMVGGKAPTPLCVFNRKPSSLAAFFLDTRFPSPPNKRGAGFLLTATGPPIPPILPVFLLSLSFSLFEETTRKRRWEKVVFEISSVLLSGFSIFFFFFHHARVLFQTRSLRKSSLSLEKKYPEIKYITPPLFRVTSRNTSRFKYKCT